MEKKLEVVDVSGQKVQIIKDLSNAGGALIYLDPPYYPVAIGKNGKISPYKLYSGDFLPVDFLKLRMRCDELTREGIPFILQNSDCEFIRILFKDYPMVEIEEPRAIKQGKGAGSRPGDKCLIITNYEKKEDFMEGIKKITAVKAAR